MQAERRGRKENLFALFHLNEYSKYLSGSVNKAVNAHVSCLHCRVYSAVFCLGLKKAVKTMCDFSHVFMIVISLH